jgi:hypothetical protein
MFPKAHTACKVEQNQPFGRVGRITYEELLLRSTMALTHLTCSLTSSLVDRRSWTNRGTAPFSITSRVLSEVPEATLVRAQAASNYRQNLKGSST